MRREFIGAIPFPSDARVLEIGCGTRVVCRHIAARVGVAEVVGIDPSAAFLPHARKLASGMPTASFVEADGRDVPLPDASFDVVVFYTILCHVPEPERTLQQAFRLLKPQGWLPLMEITVPPVLRPIGSIHSSRVPKQR